MYKVFLLSISILIFSITGFSQYTQNIRGIVKDKDSKQSLLGVNVVITNVDPQQGTTTNEDGEFNFSDIPHGRYELVFSFIGYKSSSANILLSSAHETVIEIELTPLIYQGEEIIIKSTQKGKAINTMAQVSARSFTVEETERYAGTWGDPSRMASNFAGVMAASESRNDIIIRGNSPLGLLWRLEGINVPNPNHFGALGTTGGPISMLNNNLLRNSDFFTGAFPAEYGNALSGAFDLNMRKGNDQNYEHLVQMGFNGFELGSEGPFSKNSRASYLINYRYSFLGLMEMLGVDFGPEGTVPEYQDLSFKIVLPTQNFGEISVFGIAGNSNVANYDSKKDSADYVYADFGQDFKYTSGMFTSGINHTYALSEKTRITTRFAIAGSYSETYFDSISGYDGSINPYLRQRFEEIQYSVNSELKTNINKRNTFNVGIMADIFQPQFIDSVLQNDGSFHTTTKADGSMALYQGFVEWQHRFTDDLTLYTGAHGQVFALNNSSSIEPRASLKWNFFERQSVSLGYGLHSQLQPHQLYFTKSFNELSGSYYETGNKDLDFTKSHHYVLGYNFLIAKNLRFKFETYYQDIFNVPVEQDLSEISMINFGADFAIPSYDSLENKGTGENYGIEFTLEKFFSDKYYFLFTTSLFEAKYKGSDGIIRNSAFNNNYVVNLLGGYEFKFGENFDMVVSGKYVLAGGNRYIPFDIVQSDNGRYVLEYNNDRAYEERYDPYQRLDFLITMRLHMRRITNEWMLDVQNVTNNKNIFYNNINPVTGEEEPVYHTGFSLMMGYRLRF